mgnify:CR=1 FL=1
MELSDITTPALAYLGDSVLEVCVRTYLVTERGLSTSAHLNRASLDFVRASAQSEAFGRMEPYLTEEEAAVFRRGRNMGHGTAVAGADRGGFDITCQHNSLFCDYTVHRCRNACKNQRI